MSVFRKFGIDRRTPRRHQDAKVKNPGTVKLRQPWPVLQQHFEDESDLMHNHVVDRQARFFGLTGRGVRKVACLLNYL